MATDRGVVTLATWRAMGNYIRAWREFRGVSQEALGDRIGTDKTQISKLENSRRRLTDIWLQRLGGGLDCQPAELLGPPPADNDDVESNPRQLDEGLLTEEKGELEILNGMATIPEIDVKAGAGGGGLAVRDDDNEDGVKSLWQLPFGYVRADIGAQPTSVRIIAVHGDSMEPTLHSGDRVMVDMSDHVPSPPGVFAIWDGLGVVVKRVEPILGTEPQRVRLISDNPKHTPADLTLEEAKIIGRVVWYARRM